MDTVNHLLEGASPYQVLQEQAGKLAGKWEKSGLLEGIESSTRINVAAKVAERITSIYESLRNLEKRSDDVEFGIGSERSKGTT